MSNPDEKFPRLRGRARQERNARILEHEPLCRTCKDEGRFTAATELDHVIPLFKGGLDHESNLQPLCTDCHGKKSAAERGHRFKPKTPLGLDWIQ
jgi:5-methylcytosine-specific restriction enzyme A